MKKTLVALAISTMAVAAQAAPQANSFYAGAKAGWASFHDGLTQFGNQQYSDELGAARGYKRNSVTYGVFGGYQITNHFAVELGYDDFGRAKFTENGEVTDKHTAHGAHLSLKGSYPLVKGLDVFARIGTALVRSDYKIYTPQGPFPERGHTTRLSAVFAGGLEYAVLPELAVRAEYQWLNNVGSASRAYKDSALDYRPDVGSLSLGLSYRFGQGAPVAKAPETVSKNFAFSSDVLFAFGKADLKAEAKTALDGATDEIGKLGLANPAIQVNGYTDRIGSDAANLKLSQRRAESVATYLVNKGVNSANVTAVGYGEANPVTGNTCDAVKGRKALITCLAPDRRVEIAVTGSKEVSM